LDQQQLMKAAQVAELLNVAESTIRKWVHYGFIPHVKLGRAVRFREKDIETWITERTEKGRASLAPEIQWK
jgi:excisionase family DNA binding protein